jgi:hypothetical protein
MRTGTCVWSRDGLDTLRRGLVRGDGAGSVGAGRGRGGGGILRWSQDPEPEASWSFFCVADEGPAAGYGELVGKTTVAVAARFVATRARTRLIKALAGGRSPPSVVIEASDIDGRRRRRGVTSMPR